MPTPSSGAISLQNVNTELAPVGQGSTSALSMNSTLYRRFVQNFTPSTQASLNQAYSRYTIGAPTNISNGTGQAISGTTYGNPVVVNSRVIVPANNFSGAAPQTQTRYLSTDGVNWTTVTDTGPRIVTPQTSVANVNPSIVFFNNLYITGGTSNASNAAIQVIYSSNGTSWTGVSVSGLNNVPQMFGVVPGTRVFAVQLNSNNVVHSTNGTSWAMSGVVTATTDFFQQLFQSGSTFIGLTRTQTGSTYRIYTSTDGLTWTQRASANISGSVIVLGFYAIAGTFFLVISQDALFANTASTINVWSSTNLTSWTLTSYANGPFVAAAVPGTEFNSSGLLSLTYDSDNSLFIGAATTSEADYNTFTFYNNSSIFTASSLAGPWTQRITPPILSSDAGYFQRIYTTPQRFVGSTFQGNTVQRTYLSADGINYTLNTGNFDNVYQRTAAPVVFNNRLVGVSPNRRVIWS